MCKRTFTSHFGSIGKVINLHVNANNPGVNCLGVNCPDTHITTKNPLTQILKTLKPTLVFGLFLPFVKCRIFKAHFAQVIKDTNF